MVGDFDAWIGCLLVGLLSLGCGPSVGDPGDEDVGGTDPTTSTSGDDADPGDDGNADSSGPPPSDECAEYLDDTEDGQPRTLVVRNTTDVPVYLGSAGGCSILRVAISGEDGTAPATLCGCDFVMSEDACGICSSCLSTALRIEPGAEYTETWDGAVYVQGAIPEQCLPDPTCVQNCASRRVASLASYAARLYGTVMPAACDEDPAPCECDASSDGWCEVEVEAFGTAPASDLELVVEFAHPGDADIELVIR